jgi:hypothetical protein
MKLGKVKAGGNVGEKAMRCYKCKAGTNVYRIGYINICLKAFRRQVSTCELPRKYSPQD